MTSQAVLTGRPSVTSGYPWRWLAAVVMIVGALMDMIDVTIVNVALPTIRHDLNASATQLEWVVSGYMLAFAAGLIISGNLGDVLGRKRVFLFGVGLFGLASLSAGLSGSGAELIAERPDGKLRQCANPNCQILFYDGSRSERRRWCSMALCGNRDKVAAFARRRGREKTRAQHA